MVYIKKLVMYGFKSFVRKTEIPFTPGINVILGPNGSGKSSSYDTKVLLEKGSEIELGKLIEDQIKISKQIKKLDDGIYVDGDEKIKIFSLNKKTMKIELKTISKFIKREGEILHKIKTRTGKEVKATGCHPVLVFKDNEIKSSLIRDLKNKDLIATPRTLKINGKKFNPDIARLLGYIIGDGYIAKDRIEFVNKDKEVIRDYKEILEKHFKVKIVERLDKNINRIYVRDKNFVKYIRELFMKNYAESIISKDKKIPKILMSADDKAVSNLLSGLYDTDGSVRKDISVIEFCTKNKELANQIQGLLLRFGIISKIKKRMCCATNTIKKTKNEYSYIYIYGNENFEKFYKNISLRINYKNEIIKDHLSREIVSNPNHDLLPKEINQIIKECKEILRISFKPIRKEFPSFGAYLEDRCRPTRNGVDKIIYLFKERLKIFVDYQKSLKLNQKDLMNCIKELNLSRVGASEFIGVSRDTVTNIWDKGIFNAKKNNLKKLFRYVEEEIQERVKKGKQLTNLLEKISNSDIYWDEIISLEKLEKPEFVYDLTIEDNHNFVANNIFVHNSNVSDALCFVLGRLSIKSMRAAKAKNLIFLGTKALGPAKEASVEIVFDNSDKVFTLDSSEISIKRIVRKNGQSIYKINNETNTRQEVLSLLAQAGIDPNGFNIILQGEIQNFVRMHTEERRKIIEEVSGISVYESRKQKSLKELDRTEGKLTEVISILRERTAYLNNLERERQQALRFKKLEKDVKRYKASIIHHDLLRKKKETEKIDSEISKKNKEIEKARKDMISIRTNIESLESRIASINSSMQKSTGIEQEKLNQEIADLRAELAGLNVKLDNYEKKLLEFSRQKQQLKETINNNELAVKELQKSSSSKTLSRKEQDLDTKKQELEKLEEQRKRFYTTKSELKSFRERIQDKRNTLQNYTNESSFLLKEVEALSRDLFDSKTDSSKLDSLKLSFAEKKDLLENLNRKEIELEKLTNINEHEIKQLDKLVDKISKMDICPLCKSNITEQHIKDINNETHPKMNSLKKQIDDSDKQLNDIYNKRGLLKQDLDQLSSEISKRESDLIKLFSIKEKQKQIKLLQERIEETKKNLLELENTQKRLEKSFDETSNIEQKYETSRVELQEISLRSRDSIDSEILFKQGELERSKISLKQILREEEDLNEELSSIKSEIENNDESLERKNQQEAELTKRFQRLISDRDALQSKIREYEIGLTENGNTIHNIEQGVNNLRIEKARFDAEVENLETEMLSFSNIEVIKASKEVLAQKLSKNQEILLRIGSSVNLRSLEVYDEIKKEYDTIKEKTEIISKEKGGILKIIHEIDIKKKKAFLQTLNSLNDTFSRNFSQLSTKGQVFLELENRKDPFEAGVNIIVKTGHGKYFDVTSLSGGEQTLVALSLIFAIQDLSPYCFYVLDEIDAALDKRNSERLAGLLSKYMRKGQYIVITHNDEVIVNATNLYGVSMHDGVSKIISLKI